MKPMLGSFDGSMMETELKMDNKTIKKLPSNYYENLAKILENVATKVKLGVMLLRRVQSSPRVRSERTKNEKSETIRCKSQLHGSVF